jgi:hypothetical protein
LKPIRVYESLPYRVEPRFDLDSTEKRVTEPIKNVFGVTKGTITLVTKCFQLCNGAFWQSGTRGLVGIEIQNNSGLEIKKCKIELQVIYKTFEQKQKNYVNKLSKKV